MNGAARESATTSARPADREGWRGWTIVATMFVAQMLAFGMVSYGYGVIVKPLAAEFAIPRGDAGIGMIALLVGMALASPLIGRAYDRLPGRRIVVAAAIAFGAGCAIAAVAPTPGVALASALLLVAPGAAALGPLGGSTLTVRWFDRHRGRALGVIAAASSAGGFAVTPLIGALVTQLGWRLAVAVLGLMTASLVGLLALLCIREPDGPAGDSSSHTSGTAPRAWREIVRARDFWLICLSFGALMGIAQANLLSLVPYATDRGFGLQQSIFLVSVLAVLTFIGKLLTGALADHFDKRRMLAAAALVIGAFFGLLLSGPSYPVLLAASVLLGLAMGAMVTLWSLIIVGRFGQAQFGTAMGLVIPVQLPILAVCVAGAGRIFDATGSYHPAFAAFAGLALVAGLTIQAVSVAARNGPDRQRIQRST